MMKWLKGSLDFILYSNIFIGICAVSLTFASYVSIPSAIDYSFPLLLFIFFTTLVSYGLHSLIKQSFLSDPRLDYINRHRTFLSIITSLAVIVSLVSVFFLEIEQVFLAGHLAILSFFYSIGVRYKGKTFLISKLPYLKIFLIAYAWTVLTVMLPLWNQVRLNDLVLLSLERFLLIFALAIPFDIRDANEDIGQGLKTIPGILGVKGAAYLMLLFLFMLLALQLFFNGIEPNFYSLIAVLILVTLVFPLLIRKKHPYLFSLTMDGMMLIYSVFLVGFRYFQ